jgi:pimeloyl-ACP methyl ester carboxylesterase
MATIVLVPGAWCGGWIWKYMTPLLHTAGHVTYTPTATGLGERVHLAHPDVSLTTHIQDIVNVLTYEDLHDVVLAGWSYGGMLITGAAQHVPERIQQLVYIDAQFPLDGQSSDDEEGETSQVENGVWSIAPPAEDVFGNPEYVGPYIPDPDVRHWCATRFTPQPIKTFTEPLRRSNPQAMHLPRTHLVFTVGKSPEKLSAIRERLNKEPGRYYRELAINHMAVVGSPEVIAQTILEVL